MTHWKTTIMLATCFLTSTWGQQPAPEIPSDAHFLNDGTFYSYDSKHDEARDDFATYRQSHPDDLLSHTREFYDHFFDAREKHRTKEQYRDLLQEVDNAIGLFEVEGEKCTGTDQKILTDSGLNCEYIGAALYSFREALRASNQWYMLNFFSNRADDEKFLKHAKLSGTLQARFLVATHDYIKFQHLHIGNLQSIFKELKTALADTSPFADDVWFYLLNLEKTDPAAAQFFKDYPIEMIKARLAAKYPDNSAIQGEAKSYDSHSSR